ncbi:hypothetical protein Tsubulata_048630 [Turnera subulata]|uniref:Bromo domain-containing protein n=1 Tax=Turnera subulata TaxID=218843 RepID=A0A9Q0FZN3_9ROSI|nr:hypothetical protein Tsubulata_048630 [Turnera subulata]
MWRHGVDYLLGKGDITDLAVSSNNALVASSSNDCIIRVVSFYHLLIIAKLYLFLGSRFTLSLINLSGYVRWRLPDGYPISVLRGHTGAVTAIAFSPRPSSVYQLLSSSDDGTCRIWDARSSNVRPRIYVPRPLDSIAGKNGGPSSSNGPQSHQIFCCAFSANGTIFVTYSSDHLARVWNACKPITDDMDQPNHEIDVLAGHENDVNYVQFSGCSAASRFSLNDSSKEENIPKFRNSWISHNYIVTCSRDASAIIWIPRSRRSHIRTSEAINLLGETWSWEHGITSAASLWIYCRICVWNAADGNLVLSLTGHTQSTCVLDVHPFNPRIAMSAGYDGQTIVWDVNMGGTPIRIYEISRFKLVDGKFSPDGRSIILSDDVGQLYILSTGQGESQTDAKYDQFFLGDYRPLVQDTYGNVLDQESQLMPYRRNMQDLLCDSGMNPYPEPYQSMYQKRQLGALGMEWKPSSIKFAVGPDFSLDPDFQMLPLADLDVLLEPLPEFIDTMEWEPEINVQKYSSGGEQGSLSSSSSANVESSTDDSDIEIMTSPGRRVKKRNLDERDGNALKSGQIRKSRIGRKASKKKSSTSKDEVGSEDELSESESTMHDSNVQSDESDRSFQNERNRHSKGKDICQEEPEVAGRSHEIAESHLNSGGRRRLVLKLAVWDSSRIGLPENVVHKSGVNWVGSSSNAPHEGTEIDGIHMNPLDPEYSSEIRGLICLSDGYKIGDIRWGGVKARTSKRQRLGEASLLAAFTSSSACMRDHEGQNDLNGCLSLEDQATTCSDMKDDVALVNDRIIGPDTSEVVNDVVNGSVNHGCDDEPESKESSRPISTKIRIRPINIPKDSIKDQVNGGCDNEGPETSGHERTDKMHKTDGPEESDALAGAISLPPLDDSMQSHSQPKRMFAVVYRRSKSSRDKVNIDGDSSRESIPNASDQNDNQHSRSDLHVSKSDRACRIRSMGLMEPSIQADEWGSSSTMGVGARSTRNRRTSYQYRDTSPVDRRKSQQSAKRGLWLMLSKKDASRYIPQIGDEVVYLRQGHQEYIEYTSTKEPVPWKSLKGNIRAVEFCKVERLDYATLPGSGDSCCKMILKFVDPASSVFQKSFKLTLPEVTGFPDSLVERTRFDAAIQRKWTCRGKCKVWWRNEGEEGGKWWQGRVLSVKPKSSVFPDSPWERYAVQYKSEPTETHLHSPWELFDAETEWWDEPCIDDEMTAKLLSAFYELEKSRDNDEKVTNLLLSWENILVIFWHLTGFLWVPLSLESIQSRLENKYYRRLEAVKHDIEVMLAIAESYSGKDQDLVRKMVRLTDFLSEALDSL